MEGRTTGSGKVSREEGPYRYPESSGRVKTKVGNEWILREREERRTGVGVQRHGGEERRTVGRPSRSYGPRLLPRTRGRVAVDGGTSWAGRRGRRGRLTSRRIGRSRTCFCRGTTPPRTHDTNFTTGGKSPVCLRLFGVLPPYFTTSSGLDLREDPSVAPGRRTVVDFPLVHLPPGAREVVSSG